MVQERTAQIGNYEEKISLRYFFRLRHFEGSMILVTSVERNVIAILQGDESWQDYSPSMFYFPFPVVSNNISCHSPIKNDNTTMTGRTVTL